MGGGGRRSGEAQRSPAARGRGVAVSEPGKLYEMIMRSRLIMQKRSGGGAWLDRGPLFPRQGLRGALCPESSQRGRKPKIYLPESNQLPLERPLSVPHRTLSGPPRTLCHTSLKAPTSKGQGHTVRLGRLRKAHARVREASVPTRHGHSNPYRSPSRPACQVLFIVVGSR